MSSESNVPTRQPRARPTTAVATIARPRKTLRDLVQFNLAPVVTDRARKLVAPGWSISVSDQQGVVQRVVEISPERSSEIEVQYRRNPTEFDYSYQIPGLPGQYTSSLCRQVLLSGTPVTLPRTWTPFQEYTCRLFDLDAQDPEYPRVSIPFLEQMPGYKITKIHRTQNLPQYHKYYLEEARIRSECTDPPETLVRELMYFGSGSLPPSDIITSQDGIDLHSLANENLWGKRAIHFSQSPGYADQFAFHKQNGSRQLLCATVATGSVYPYGARRSISSTEPPIDIASGIRHHSVSGTTDQGDVYAVYQENQYFLSYLITYRKRVFRTIKRSAKASSKRSAKVASGQSD